MLSLHVSKSQILSKNVKKTLSYEWSFLMIICRVSFSPKWKKIYHFYIWIMHIRKKRHKVYLVCNENNQQWSVWCWVKIHFFFGHIPWHEDLSSPTRDEPEPPTVEAQSPNHWTTREFPVYFSLRSARHYSKSFININSFNIKEEDDFLEAKNIHWEKVLSILKQ